MTASLIDLLIPDWPAPEPVQACCSTRHGGVSQAPWHSLNLGDHVGDKPEHVAENRRRLLSLAPETQCYWLEQVHGIEVLNLDSNPRERRADAASTRLPNTVCAVMTADCLPVLFCNRAGSEVAAAHAGWRGLHGGVLEATVAALQSPPEQLMAWLGPAIGPDNFEVGKEVLEAFVALDFRHTEAFKPQPKEKYLADIYALARHKLHQLGLPSEAIYGGGLCTYADAERFYSYRRDIQTGRMASLIWINP